MMNFFTLLYSQRAFEQGYMGVKILFDYLFLNKTPRLEYNSPIKIVAKENADYFKEALAVEFVVYQFSIY